MTSPLQTPDFFILEAGEALDELEALLRAESVPDPVALVRAARLLRGSAVMASQQPIARAAAALEVVARSCREQPGRWSEELRVTLRGAVDEFRALIARVRGWSDADTARSLRLGRSLELAVGQGSGSLDNRSDTEGGTLAAGVRAFVAREGALVASALDRAARALRVSPADREALYTVIRRMQSLRGLAELGELTPLPEVLDGIEMAIGDLTRTFAPPPGVDQVIDAAAKALTRLSKDVADAGRPDPEAQETRHFTELLVRIFAVEHDVVPIESLYLDGDPAPVQQPPTATGFQTTATLGPLELVSHGEHLARTADLLSRARSATERDLRLYQLLGTLRSIGVVGSDPVAGALGVFAQAVREALGAGVGASESAIAPLVACLREAGELLRSVADGDNRMQLSRRLLDVAHRLQQLDVVPIEQLLLPDEPATESPVVESPVVESATVEPRAETLPAVDERPIVPIESLAPDEVPAEASQSGDAGPLERTFRTYGQLRRERPPQFPSLAALLYERQPAPEPAPEPIAVPIADLCYSGRAALERAGEVREQLARALAADVALPTIRPLLDELLDLVPLARAEH